MRLAAVTSLFKYYPLPRALAAIAEAGYEGVELWGGLPHAWTDDFYEAGRVDEGLAGRCRALVEASGLEPVMFLPEQCFYPVNFLADDAPPFEPGRLRERSLRYFERAIRLAPALGFGRVLVTAPFWGWRSDGFARGHEMEKVVDIFGHLAREAERAGVTLVLEPLTHLETTGVETLDDLLAVLDGVASKALVAMVDTGHVHVTAKAHGLESGAYFEEHVERLGERLAHLHIDDNLGDLDSHLLPGAGTFDFPRAYEALRGAGYDGFLSMELIMFGASPVPPEPERLLRRAREATLRHLDDRD
jgi:fructoselysine 3-epimerase